MGQYRARDNTVMFQQRCGTNGKGQYRDSNKQVTSREGQYRDGANQTGSNRRGTNVKGQYRDRPTQTRNQWERVVQRQGNTDVPARLATNGTGQYADR